MAADYRQYRAPQQDNSALVDPGWRELFDLAANATHQRLTLAGEPLEAIAASARQELLASAATFTGAYSNVQQSPPAGPIIVSGHQPQLFHAGVWFKNFALDAIAKATGGVGVNLIIDSDLCREVSIRVPSGELQSPRVITVPYDAPSDSAPYEQRNVNDRKVLEAFPQQVTQAIGPLMSGPLVNELWQRVEAARESNDRLGLILSRARHRLEQSWGVSTLELPFSRVCDTRSFRVFAIELFGRAEAFQRAYNAALADYRAAHKLRSDAQPLPDLGAQGDWVETPFWFWQEEQPTRRPLFARPAGSGVELSDLSGWSCGLSGDTEQAVEQLTLQRERGAKIHSRALATTLYCRMVLADLFLHGIGGAKYDQVTDRVSERFFGVAPPRHGTLSATFRLPIEHESVTADSRRRLRGKLRDMRYHPEHALHEPNKEAAIWLRQKQEWIAQEKTPENARERHQAIEQSNLALQQHLAAERQQLVDSLEAADSAIRSSALLDSREYSYCLFPAEDLRDRVSALLPKKSFWVTSRAQE